MSSKGYSLGNRPSEYFFANIQREKLDFYDLTNYDYFHSLKIINEYVTCYNKSIPQSCLEYKTPESYLKLSGVKTKINSNMCLNFVS